MVITAKTVEYLCKANIIHYITSNKFIMLTCTNLPIT